MITPDPIKGVVMPMRNPVGTEGFDFLEFTTSDTSLLSSQFISLGFQPVATHNTQPVTIYQRDGLRFIINQTPESQASKYGKIHGTSISAIGFRVSDAKTAMLYLSLKGAIPYQPIDETIVYDIPSVYGVGNSLIYLADYQNGIPNYASQFSSLSASEPSGFLHHVSFHLYRGHRSKWVDFFTKVFGFHQANSKNHTMISPCKKIRLPLTEPAKSATVTDVFLNDFKGEGIENIALGKDHTYKEVQITREGLQIRDSESLMKPVDYGFEEHA